MLVAKFDPIVQRKLLRLNLTEDLDHDRNLIDAGHGKGPVAVDRNLLASPDVANRDADDAREGVRKFLQSRLKPAELSRISGRMRVLRIRRMRQYKEQRQRAQRAAMTHKISPTPGFIRPVRSAWRDLYCSKEKTCFTTNARRKTQMP